MEPCFLSCIQVGGWCSLVPGTSPEERNPLIVDWGQYPFSTPPLMNATMFVSPRRKYGLAFMLRSFYWRDSSEVSKAWQNVFGAGHGDRGRSWVSNYAFGPTIWISHSTWGTRPFKVQTLPRPPSTLPLPRAPCLYSPTLPTHTLPSYRILTMKKA